MVDDQPVLENGAVVISDNTIVAVGTRRDMNAAYTAKKTIDGKGRVLMLGLINGHTHSAMTLFRGMADDLNLMT